MNSYPCYILRIYQVEVNEQRSLLFICVYQVPGMYCTPFCWCIPGTYGYVVQQFDPRLDKVEELTPNGICEVQQWLKSKLKYEVPVPVTWYQCLLPDTRYSSVAVCTCGVLLIRHTHCLRFAASTLTPSEPQSRFGGKPVNFQAV